MENISREEDLNKKTKIIELKEKLGMARKENPLGTNDKIVEFIKNIRKKYPDYQNYELYHLLVGSSLIERTSKFDFPDQDSVANFIESL